LFVTLKLHHQERLCSAGFDNEKTRAMLGHEIQARNANQIVLQTKVKPLGGKYRELEIAGQARRATSRVALDRTGPNS
jgi:hypothetical protein